MITFSGSVILDVIRTNELHVKRTFSLQNCLLATTGISILVIGATSNLAYNPEWNEAALSYQPLSRDIANAVIRTAPNGLTPRQSHRIGWRYSVLAFVDSNNTTAKLPVDPIEDEQPPNFWRRTGRFDSTIAMVIGYYEANDSINKQLEKMTFEELQFALTPVENRLSITIFYLASGAYILYSAVLLIRTAKSG